MPEGIIPPWMEDVAKAGGFEEHAKQKAQKELLDKMDKMPPEKFFQLKDMLGSLERMLDVGGSDLGILSGITDSVKDTIKTELEGATAELMNMVNTSINTLLAPFMPAIQAALNGFNTSLSRGIGTIEALLTGKLDEYLRGLLMEAQANEETYYHTQQFDYIALLKYKIEHPDVDLDALAAAGTAGGVYSGQFDLDPDTLADMLANFNIPVYTEE